MWDTKLRVTNVHSKNKQTKNKPHRHENKTVVTNGKGGGVVVKNEVGASNVW